MRSNKKKSKKGIYSKILIAFIIAINTAFTIAVLEIFRETASEPTALIAAWFSFTTGELFALATIKIKKTKTGTESAESYVENSDNSDQ